MSNKIETKGNCCSRGKNLSDLSLEDLTSSFKSHEIEINEEESLRNPKSITFKSKSKKLNVKTLQVEEHDDEDYEYMSYDDKFSLVYRKIQCLCSKRKRKIPNKEFKYSKDPRDKKEVDKKIIHYECKEPRHFRN